MKSRLAKERKNLYSEVTVIVFRDSNSQDT
jgi:hypothetical protein